MRQSFTIYRVIRIDGEFDTDILDSVDESIASSIAKHIENTVSKLDVNKNEPFSITDITDCGDSC